MTNLAGKVVFITGASSGIGTACARLFAKEGSKLVLTARRLDRLTQLKEELLSGSPAAAGVHVAELDVRDYKQVQEVVKGLPDEYKAIDVLVNNAGLAVGVNLVHETPMEDYDRMMDTNVKGVMHLIKEVLPGMLARNSGHIINIGSIAGHEAYRHGSVYCASKWALNAINTSLRKELVGTPLRVTAISPGMVETEFSVVRFNGDTDKAASMYKGFEPMVATDVAEAVIFAATRHPRVQVGDIIMYACNQASTEVIHRQ
eukprot:TRINITY_DN3340_c0_g1_i1.p1 TRINITY_DN3340_c0_g1~~TRINITY_DN3340_c0_g1_i1.p1  ORF type:complete len:259 (+),score=53.34 TRINITY_DN3340_c0_g1_i1:137-913(+)